jgi:hypothetical protein
MASIFTDLEKQVQGSNAVLEGGRELNYLNQKDTYLGAILQRIISAVNQTAKNATVSSVVPKLGYVKGNIRVISYRANTMKSNASLEEIKRLAEWLQGETDARTECTA